MFMSFHMLKAWDNKMMEGRVGKVSEIGYKYISGHGSFEKFNFENDGIRFNISKDLLGLFGFLKIYSNGIEVYNGGWIHSTPKELKKHIKESILYVKFYNKECRKYDLEKRYNDSVKQEKIKKKENERKEYTDNQKKLNNFYRNRE